MHQPLLSVRNAYLSYPGETALSDLTLEIHPGEMVSVVGPSGCGKTSLLYAIAGLRGLDDGRIELDHAATRCGLMFQDDRLLPWLTVRDNIMLGMPDQRRRVPTQQDPLSGLLQTLQLQPYAAKYPDYLSGGQRQRVALARMLVRHPRMLLLDEPFAALDEQTREKLQEELLDYVQTHEITLLLVTHSIAEAVFLGSRIVIMHKAGVYTELANPNHLHPQARDQAAYYDTIRLVRTQLNAAAATDREKES